MTLLALLTFLALFFVAGAPIVLLAPRDDDGRRVLLAPVLGLCITVLAACFLASFGLTGHVIGRGALAAVAVIGAATVFMSYSPFRLPFGWKIERPSAREFLSAAPALSAGLLASALIAWPLFASGALNYWGFANPDEAYYMTIVEHLEDHPFSQLPPNRFHTSIETGFAGEDGRARILALCYLLPTVSVLTGIESRFLFTVLCAAMLFLVAPSAYMLCRTGLGRSRGTALISALLVTSSAVVAQTFYQQSLGAVFVAFMCPVTVTLGICYARKPAFGAALLLAIILAGMLFCYFPGFAVLGIVLAGTFAAPILRRKLALRDLVIVGCLVALVMGAVFARQAVALLSMLSSEAVSSRLATVEDEILLAFDTTLTDDFVPFVWGFKIMGLPTPTFLGPPVQASLIVFFSGVALFAAILLAFRGKNFPAEFKGMLVAVAGVTALYFARRNGYGIYKLITWLAPLLIVALGVACVALYQRGSKLGRWAAMILLVGYTGLNLAYIVRMAAYTRGVRYGGGIHNMASVTLGEVHALEDATSPLQSEPVFAAMPDQVLQRWATVFLPSSNVHYLPWLNLNAEDSDSQAAIGYRQAATANLKGGYLLHTTAALPDILSAPDTGSVWRNRVFAITPLDQIRNLPVLGAGWYRGEILLETDSRPQPFRWLRKRAEILLLHPSPVSQRIGLLVRAGYGNSSPVRHVALLLNGVKFDEVTIHGQSHFLSKPFQPSGVVSQIEIEVQEDAKPLPRKLALWNGWVPRDARRLNLGVLHATVGAAGKFSGASQSKADFRSAGEFSRAFYDGIYADRWLGAKASIDLRVPSQSRALHIRGVAPNVATVVFPMPVQLFADGELLGEAIVERAGHFDLSVRLSSSWTQKADRDIRLGIQPGSACFLPSGDPRCLTIQLEEIGFDAPATGRPEISGN